MCSGSSSHSVLPLLIPDCALPCGIQVCTTLRIGGASEAPYDSFNLGLHVGDDVAAVEQNRRRLVASLTLPSMPVWLTQTHGTNVCLSASPDKSESHDAAWTATPGRVLAILTADCLPVVFMARNGQEIAVAHAGWRGLAAGVLQNTVAQFTQRPETLLAWLGPAIGPQHFEVGPEVRERFLSESPFKDAGNKAFVAGEESHRRAGRWYADLYQLARLALCEAGLTAVYGGGLCTYSDQHQFYSYRRDGKASGRMATLAWIS